MRSHRAGAALLALATLALMSGCGGDAADRPSPSALGDDAITVASFDFAESELLAEIYGQALEAEGFAVDRVLRLGPREFVAPALVGGLVELVPEYAGTALQFASLGAGEPTADVEATHRALAGVLRDRDLVALAPAPAQNKNAFVVSRQTAAEYGVDEISDLAAIAPDLTFGGPRECPTRPFCALGLERVYDVEFGEFVALDTGGPVTRQALQRGLVDVGLLFTTDPQIENYAVLADDRHLQPAENVVPVVHRSVVDRWGARVVETVDEVSGRLTTDGLRALNAEVDASDGDTAGVATLWLRAQGLG